MTIWLSSDTLTSYFACHLVIPLLYCKLLLLLTILFTADLKISCTDEAPVKKPTVCQINMCYFL